MDLEIKKEHFSTENFDSKAFLNSLSKTNTESESDMFNFKIKLIQREFATEINQSTDNLLKSVKYMEDDISKINVSNSNFIQNVTNINKNKIPNKQLEELD